MAYVVDLCRIAVPTPAHPSAELMAHKFYEQITAHEKGVHAISFACLTKLVEEYITPDYTLIFLHGERIIKVR